MTEKALQELASIFNPATEIPQGETPLLIAVGAVGKALGITIRPAAESESSRTLEDIARASGFRIRRVTLTPQWWTTDCGPLLGFTQEGNLPVAILPVKATKYKILEPVELKYTRVNQAAASKLSNIAYTFYRPFPDKEISKRDILKFSLRAHRADYFKIILVGVIATLLGMVTPIVTGILIDNAIPYANRKLLIQMGLGLVAASFGIMIFQLVQSFVVLRIQTKVSLDTQAAAWDRLLKLKPNFFRKYSSGDLHERVSAISEIREQLSSTVLQTLFTSLFSLFNLGLLLIYSFPLALVAIVIAIISIIITAISSIFTRQKMRPLQELSGNITGLTVQLIGGVSKLRVAVAESKAFGCWAKKYTQQVKLMLSTQLIEDMLAAFNVILPSLSSIVLFGLAAYLTGQSQGNTGLSTGTFLAFNTAFASFIFSATQLSDTIIDVLEITILWERVQPILKAKLEVDSSKYHPGELSGNLRLDQVCFRYRQDSPLILDNVSLEIKAGEFIAIVGPSGSGKSTTIRLLLGFETAESGNIFYDGKDLSALNIVAVRRQLGVVLQNGRIMSGSIWENIAGSAIVTQDEAWEALYMAGLADDIEAMPMGIHTIISEGGGNLSGGQRQRLFIARALARKPKILLFDEATSALDNRTQEIVTQSLEKLGITRIVIAHRLSTIRHADRIYVMQAGKILQQGSFEELAGTEGLFMDLMMPQMTSEVGRKSF
ncbi:MAG: NHLP bacteriocin export ABC transporter permease/ATPase subunit [Cyanobacteria bacterium J06633_8]